MQTDDVVSLLHEAMHLHIARNSGGAEGCGITLEQLVERHYEQLAGRLEDVVNATVPLLHNIETAESRGLAAIEFWSVLCDAEQEKRTADDEDGMGPQCKQCVARAVPRLVPGLLHAMEQQEEERTEAADGKRSWGASVAAGTCLALVAQAAGDAAVPCVASFLDRGLPEKSAQGAGSQGDVGGGGWRAREAAWMALGCMSEGSSEAAITPLVQKWLLALIGDTRDPSAAVRDTALWTLGRLVARGDDTERSWLPPALPGVVCALSERLRDPRESGAVRDQVYYAAGNLAQWVCEQRDRDDPVPLGHGEWQLLCDSLMHATQRGGVEGPASRMAYGALEDCIKASSQCDVASLQPVAAALLERLNGPLASLVAATEGSSTAAAASLESCQQEVDSLLACLQRVIEAAARHADLERHLTRRVLEEVLQRHVELLELARTGQEGGFKVDVMYACLGISSFVHAPNVLTGLLECHVDRIMAALLALLDDPPTSLLVMSVGDLLRTFGLGAARFTGQALDKLVAFVDRATVQRGEEETQEEQAGSSDKSRFDILCACIGCICDITLAIGWEVQGQAGLPGVFNALTLLLSSEGARDRVAGGSGEDSKLADATVEALDGMVAGLQGENDRLVEFFRHHPATARMLLRAAASAAGVWEARRHRGAAEPSEFAVEHGLALAAAVLECTPDMKSDRELAAALERLAELGKGQTNARTVEDAARVARALRTLSALN